MPLSSWAIIESLPGILYVYNRQGRFLKWNENFTRWHEKAVESGVQTIEADQLAKWLDSLEMV